MNTVGLPTGIHIKSNRFHRYAAMHAMVHDEH
jgi:hypothetical protein